ncbi:arsinothricin resistance N-acetyltransferase ArsN1 [Caulobacter segnis]|uniref:arsinothricin resistance N-acetyltransferase ArsN1 family A n=1 Tax=Caulobacter segnis TaxID=88688 RepID=UPI00240F9920|nr:arsinothricin resistance N-acetyltransferase ArsN1 family A [Caulobacter segnis]MDG2522958.1 arsinothricin resistance N-acetyltransferase ArsN1 [Caulobacter segnis]
MLSAQAGVRLRTATRVDAAAMAEIYNQGIEDRVATFETSARSTEQMAGWFEAGAPIVVAEVDGEVAGFAAAFAYSDRCCYAGIYEFSVYVHRNWRGQKVGEAAMGALIDAVHSAGGWKLLSRIFVENSASRALMAKVGFKEIGVHEKHGKLDGVWRDCVIVERLIAENIS